MTRVTWKSLLVFLSLLASSAAASPPAVIVTTYASVDKPIELSFDGAGYLYVGNNDNSASPSRIHRVGPGGSPVVDYGPLVSDPDALIVHDPAGLVSATPGSVIVGGQIGASGQIVEIRPDQTSAVLSASSLLDNPSRFEYDHQGRLLFSDYNGERIFVMGAGSPTVLIDTPSGARPESIAIDSQDQIYVSTTDGVIRIYDSSGVLVDDSFATGLGQLPGIAFGPGGLWGTNLYAIANGQLLRFDQDGTPALVEDGFATASFGVLEIEFGPDGSMYASDYPNNRVLKITPVTPVPAFSALGAAALVLALTLFSFAFAIRRGIGLQS